MSLLNIHYKKIAVEYLKVSNYINFQVAFTSSKENWFFHKLGDRITFNTYHLKSVSRISKKSAVNFMDCLFTCCLHHIPKLKEREKVVTFSQALTVIDTPFKNKFLEMFLKDRLGYTPKENYQNLVIADEIENTTLLLKLKKLT